MVKSLLLSLLCYPLSNQCHQCQVYYKTAYLQSGNQVKLKQALRVTVKWSGPPRGLLAGKLVRPTEITYKMSAPPPTCLRPETVS